MKFQIYRTHASSYQDSKFLANEKRVLEDIPEVEYIQSLQDYTPGAKLILITNTHTKPHEIPRNVLDSTVLMIHPNSGYDNLTDQFRSTVNFPIIVGNPIRSHAVAEYTMSALFHHFTELPHHHHWHEERFYPRNLLRDQKVLILGHGTIGKLLASSLAPLCPNLQVFDPNKSAQSSPYVITNEWNRDFLKETSVLILAASLNQTSHKIINKENIGLLSNQCLIVNPARGELIDENALCDFLQKNPRTYAFLDVFEKEPFTPGHMHQIKNLNKTSHIAGIYKKLNADIISFEFIVMKDFIKMFQENTLESFRSEYSECLLQCQ